MILGAGPVLEVGLSHFVSTLRLNHALFGFVFGEETDLWGYWVSNNCKYTREFIDVILLLKLLHGFSFVITMYIINLCLLDLCGFLATTFLLSPSNQTIIW